MQALMLSIAVAVAAGLPGDAYRDIVEAYRAGDRTAIDRVGAISEPWVRKEVGRLRRLGERRDREFEEFPFAAAAVLHTERAFADEAAGDAVAASAQLALARAWIETGKEALTEVRRRWLLATGLHSLSRGSVDSANELLAEGVQAFPSDAGLWFAAGVAAETDAIVIAQVDATSSSRVRWWALDADRKRALRTAQKRLRTALALDPSLAEARIRLGRVLSILGKSDEALIELEAALQAGSDPAQRYLALIFIGRIEETRGRWDRAIDRHRQAIAAQPAAEAGWVALAHALDRAGERGAATAALARVLAAESELDPPPDPLREYPFGPSSAASAALDVLRALAR